MLYEKHKERTWFKMGVVIVNDTEKDHNVKFLGYQNEAPPDGVKLINLFGDTLFDDNRLSELRNWITAVGVIQISFMRFYSSDKNQISEPIRIEKLQPNGVGCEIPIYVNRYTDPDQFSNLSIDVKYHFIIDSWTSFSYLIKRFTGCQIVFYPSQQQIKRLQGHFSGFHESMKKDYQEYTASQKKKFLFII